jgi:hypothetical protein
MATFLGFSGGGRPKCPLPIMSPWSLAGFKSTVMKANGLNAANKFNGKIKAGKIWRFLQKGIIK